MNVIKPTEEIKNKFAVSKKNIFWCCQNVKKKVENILTLADKCLKNQHIPLRLFILTEIEISGLKLICQNVFTLSEWYHICSQTSVSGWASTPNSSVPHCLTYQGRFDPEPVWNESHIFVKLARAHEAVFCARVRLLEDREYLILFKACQDSIIATGCFLTRFHPVSLHFTSWSDCISDLVATKKDLLEKWLMASASWYSWVEDTDPWLTLKCLLKKTNA